MIKIHNKNFGFTLVEILTVLSIMAILLTLMIPNLRTAQQKARDGDRKSDLKQIQGALEIYKADNLEYPSESATLIGACGGSCTWGGPFTDASNRTYMSVLPQERNTGATYIYFNTININYQLCALLEYTGEDGDPDIFDCDGVVIPCPCNNQDCKTTAPTAKCNYQVTNP